MFRFTLFPNVSINLITLKLSKVPSLRAVPLVFSDELMISLEEGTIVVIRPADIAKHDFHISLRSSRNSDVGSTLVTNK